MKTFIYLTVLTIAVASAHGLETSEIMREYLEFSQRQFRQPFETWQLKIDSVTARGSDLLKSFDYRQELIIQKIQSVERSLDLLETLSSTRKQCVQKYRPLLLNSFNARSKLTLCRNTLVERLSILTSTTKIYLTNAENTINLNLPAQIATCNMTEIEDCVIKNVAIYSELSQKHLEVVEAYLETSICGLGDCSRESNTCSFKVEQEALTVAGSVLLSIERCLEQSENSCPCNGEGEKSLIELESLRSLIEGE